MTNKKSEGNGQENVESGEVIFKKDEEVGGARKHHCFRCDRLKPMCKGFKFCKFEVKEDGTPVNTVVEIYQKFNELKAEKSRGKN